MQRCVRKNDTDQLEVWKIKSLCHHLGSKKNVGISFSERIKTFLKFSLVMQ